MATRQEIIDALAALKTDVQNQSTVIASAEAAYKGLADQLLNSVATATDLDSFKAEITTIATQVQTDSSGLATAIATPPTLGSGPQSPPTPPPPPSPPATPGP